MGAHIVLQIHSLILALSELWLCFCCPQNLWVNPGMGMFGWSAAFPFGRNIPVTDIVHPIGATAAALAYAFLSRRGATVETPSARSKRFMHAALIVGSLFYPIYDSKHWYAANRLQNVAGEYLIVYTPLVAISELLRTRACVAPSDFKPATFERWLDVHQVVLLSLSCLRYLWQFLFFDEGWAAPSSFPEPEREELLKAPSEPWYYFVAWGANILGAIIIFCVAEFYDTRTSTEARTVSVA